jgi:hypothetical protein
VSYHQNKRERTLAEPGAIVAAKNGDTICGKFPANAEDKTRPPYGRQNLKMMKGLYYTRVQVWSDELIVFGISGGDSL